MDHARCVFVAYDEGGPAELSADWTYIAIPTTEMFRMPFTEQLGMIRKALEYIHRRIPEVEKVLRNGGRQLPRNGMVAVAPTVKLRPLKKKALAG